MDQNSTEALGAFATIFLISGIVYVAIAVFAIWAFWRIFVKAGYNGALSLLNLIGGIGTLVCVIILGFGRWPIEDQLAAMNGGPKPYPPPPAPPPPAPPPGTSVMPQ